MFVKLPPMIQVVMLTPRFCRWFIDLTWVRLFTCRLRKPRNSESAAAIPLTLGTHRHESHDYDNKGSLLPAENGYETLMMTEDS